MSDSKDPVGRRGFLKRAAASGAGLAATAPIALAQQAALKPETAAAVEVTPTCVRAPTSWSTSSSRWASNTAPPIPAPASAACTNP